MKVNEQLISDSESSSSEVIRENPITFDEALERVGSQNRYQILCFIYFGLQWMIANWILMSPIYLFRSPSVDCQQNELCHDQCMSRESFGDGDCHKFICELPEQDWSQYLSGESLTNYFDPPLVCSKKSITTVLQSLVYMGSFVGFFVFSFIADNYGRKLALALGWGFTTIGSFILGFSSNIPMIGAGLFICGFGVNPSITIHYSFINEHSQGKFREYQNAGVQVFFGVAEMMLVGMAILFPSWTTYTRYFLMVPISVLNLPVYFMFESPKYVYSKSKSKAIIILNKIAKINGRQKVFAHQVEDCKLNKFNKQRYFSIKDLLCYRSLRVMFICGFLIFLQIQYVFYGLTFTIEKIGFNFYVNAIIIATFETLSYCVCDFLIPHLPRRKSIFLGFFVSGIICFFCVGLNYIGDCGDNNKCPQIIIQVILAGIIRFTITTVWTFAYVYLSELFPTVVRSLALGLISAGGQIGSIACPYVFVIFEKYEIPQLAPIGIVAIIGALLVIPLKETYQQPLSDQIEEDLEVSRTSWALSN